MTQKKGGLGSVRKDNTTMHELSSWGGRGGRTRERGEGADRHAGKSRGWVGGGAGERTVRLADKHAKPELIHNP